MIFKGYPGGNQAESTQDGKDVARGEATVMAPSKKETVTVIPPPAVQLLDDPDAASGAEN